MKQSKKVVARIIILILALFTVIPGTVSQKVYAEPGGSESSQAADASKDDSNKKEEKKEEMTLPINISSVGSDEVGTGDYYGPIVVTASYVNKDDIPFLTELGVVILCSSGT